MGPLVGEATAGLANFELVGLDCRDMLAAGMKKFVVGSICDITPRPTSGILFETKHETSLIDAVNTQSTSSGRHNGKNDVDITFAFMLPARWRLSVNSVYRIMNILQFP